MSGKSNNSQVYIGDLAGDTDSDEGFSSFDDEDFFDEDGPGTGSGDSPPPPPPAAGKKDDKMMMDEKPVKKPRKKKTFFIRDNIALSGMSSGNKLLALIFGLFLFISILGLILFFEFPDILGKSASELNQPTPNSTQFPDNIAERFKEVPSNKRVGYATIAVASIGLFFLLVKLWWYFVQEAKSRKGDRGWVWFAYLIAFVAVIFATVSNMGPKYEEDQSPSQTATADPEDYDLPLYIATPVLGVIGFGGVVFFMFTGRWSAVVYPWILVCAGLIYGSVNRFFRENFSENFTSDDGSKNGKPVVTTATTGFYAASAFSIFVGVALSIISFRSTSSPVARIAPFWATVLTAIALLVVTGVMYGRVSPNSASPDPMTWLWAVSGGILGLTVIAALIATALRNRADYIDKWVDRLVDKGERLKNVSKKNLDELEAYAERLRDRLRTLGDGDVKDDVQEELNSIDENIEIRKTGK
jgi:hypothetical protein